MLFNGMASKINLVPYWSLKNLHKLQKHTDVNGF